MDCLDHSECLRNRCWDDKSSVVRTLKPWFCWEAKRRARDNGPEPGHCIKPAPPSAVGLEGFGCIICENKIATIYFIESRGRNETISLKTTALHKVTRKWKGCGYTQLVPVQLSFTEHRVRTWNPSIHFPPRTRGALGDHFLWPNRQVDITDRYAKNQRLLSGYQGPGPVHCITLFTLHHHPGVLFPLYRCRGRRGWAERVKTVLLGGRL